ncbi:DUF397 domain-containing protein [Haloechinothrix sp. LS1_15]|uniref:DUF397 domain-containing protein n=1 Tax=Haloechinothrix sp. LS1_15 TaxID=2652248 RepID=UPI002947173D|nr:DUF397 domain-containing protein [Haloechinothrix sp. LS1_15]MDV6010894.1 DUF397 domain-containing protein [Haloechinothrix sp. LS1_15]
MSAAGVTTARWRKSGYSSDSLSCVEVALSERVVGVRDSKAPGNGTLVVPTGAWRGFLDALP